MTPRDSEVRRVGCTARHSPLKSRLFSSLPTVSFVLPLASPPLLPPASEATRAKPPGQNHQSKTTRAKPTEQNQQSKTNRAKPKDRNRQTTTNGPKPTDQNQQTEIDRPQPTDQNQLTKTNRPKPTDRHSVRRLQTCRILHEARWMVYSPPRLRNSQFYRSPR